MSINHNDNIETCSFCGAGYFDNGTPVCSLRCEKGYDEMAQEVRSTLLEGESSEYPVMDLDPVQLPDSFYTSTEFRRSSARFAHDDSPF